MQKLVLRAKKKWIFQGKKQWEIILFHFMVCLGQRGKEEEKRRVEGEGEGEVHRID